MRPFNGPSTIDGRSDQIANRLAAAIEPSDTVYAASLSANVAETLAIPAGARFVNFSATGDFYAKFGTSGAVTAAVPADNVVGDAAALNPGTRILVDGITHIALIAPANAIVTLEFWN